MLIGVLCLDNCFKLQTKIKANSIFPRNPRTKRELVLNQTGCDNPFVFPSEMMIITLKEIEWKIAKLEKKGNRRENIKVGTQGLVPALPRA